MCRMCRPVGALSSSQPTDEGPQGRQPAPRLGDGDCHDDPDRQLGAADAAGVVIPKLRPGR